MSEVLKIRNVTKNFSGITALDNLSLDLEENSITGLIGPNGSGKSTLFNVICGVYEADSGEIYHNDARLDKLSSEEIYQRGLVRTFQIPHLFWDMTVLDNMILGGRNQIGSNLRNLFFSGSKWKDQEEELMERAHEILDFLDLTRLKDSYPTECSGGQIKLLEIGRALISDPDILLMDEPTAGVNPALAADILERIEELRERENLTFFIIEHRIEFLLEITDEVFVMNKGSVLTRDHPDEVLEKEEVKEIYMGA